MTQDHSESDFDYYITVKLSNGSVLNPRRIAGITLIAAIESYVNKEQIKRPQDKIYWSKRLG
jgi:hypothetical protein